MNAKRKGTRNELRSKLLLEAAGYRVTRAAASMGEWDLIAISESETCLVQVKTRDLPGTEEMKRLREFKAPSCCHRKIIHRYLDGVTAPEIFQVEFPSRAAIAEALEVAGGDIGKASVILLARPAVVRAEIAASPALTAVLEGFSKKGNDNGQPSF